MLYRLAADALVLLHLGFILFVVGGGFLAWRWRKLVWIHVPVAMWGALIEFAGWVCPLTPWENDLRRMAGGVGYEGGFIEHYLVPVLYPPGLTVGTQIVLGVFVVVINGFAYAVYFTRRRGSRDKPIEKPNHPRATS